MEKRCCGINCKKKKKIVHIINKKPHHILIRTHDDKPIWFLLKKYINDMKKDTIFDRVDLLNSVYRKEVVIPIRKYQTTVDQYRRYISMAGCLDHIGFAKYQKIKNIPEHLSVFKLRNHVYSGTYRSWFLKVEDL